MTSADEYKMIRQQASSLLESESDPLANAANLAALIFNAVEELNWTGFYFLRKAELVLGPFQGQIACTRIPVGTGVCGTAFANMTTQAVADVDLFEGHIPCDTNSRSEVVVPFQHDLVAGVLDVDSPIINRFSESEVNLFEGLVEIYVNSLVAAETI